MTREEVKQEFLNSPYLITLSNAMDRIKFPDSEPKPEQVFEELMDRAFADTTMTEGYMQEMLNGDFSNIIIERFAIYLRNCLRHDLAELISDTTVIYEP